MCRKESLKIRTYRIVPLSQRSGLLEWCSNTMPIGTLLVGDNRKSGAHGRYYPDVKNTVCMEAYKKAAKNSLEKYKKICEAFPPVMKFILMELFPSAQEFYRGRNFYTKSVAATSMVGHILGIGDRHLNNILVDLKTGELVHIDFGVAFDKGKILPTPELIPFRLTRDIVDGFGPAGVEGVFR